MRFVLLALALLLLTPPGTAQRLVIEDVVLPAAPQLRAGEARDVVLGAMVRNAGRNARFAYVTAQEIGGTETERVAEQIDGGGIARVDVPIRIDLTGRPDEAGPVVVTLRAYTDLTTVVHTRRVELEVERETGEILLSVSDRVHITVPPIEIEPKLHGVTMQLEAGADDFRTNSFIICWLRDKWGGLLHRPLFISGPRLGRPLQWPLTTDSPYKAQRLTRPIAPSSIGGIECEHEPGTELPSDTYDHAELRSVALLTPDGEVIRRWSGSPLIRFEPGNERLRLEHTPHTPSPPSALYELEVVLDVGSGGTGQRGQFTATVYDRDGQPLIPWEQGLGHTVYTPFRDQPVPTGARVPVAVPLLEPVAPDRIGHVELEWWPVGGGERVLRIRSAELRAGRGGRVMGTARTHPDRLIVIGERPLRVPVEGHSLGGEATVRRRGE